MIEQFFQDEKGILSMARLLMFCSFFVASYVIVIDVYKSGLSEGIFGLYLATYAGTYGFGKWMEYKMLKSHEGKNLP